MQTVTEPFPIAPVNAVESIRPIADRISRMLNEGWRLTAFVLADDGKSVFVTFELD